MLLPELGFVHFQENFDAANPKCSLDALLRVQQNDVKNGVNEALSFNDADIQMLSRDMLSAGRLFLCCNKILIQKLFQWRIYIVKFWTPSSPPLDKIFFIFMQFSVKFRQIIGWCPFGLGAPYRGNPGSAAVFICFCVGISMIPYLRLFNTKFHPTLNIGFN